MQSWFTGVIAAVALGGCIKHYNHDAFLRTAEDRPPSHMASAISLADDPYALKANWEEVGIRCSKVRAAMLREADSLSTRQKVVGGAFAIAGAAIGASSAIYAAAATNPQREVTVVLGIVGGLVATPSIFFLGADAREKEVRERHANIEAQDRVVIAAYENVQTSVIALDALRKARDAASSDDEKKLTVAAYNEGKTTFGNAQRDLSIALIRLSGMCE
ncbi:MAG: hypothetical protein JNK82_34195 [Myxococcaceae bacterium]|nr:hypothetical protein [Myxococcaceae bacterium]